ncbi:hypothetical protein [Prosthecomicrobium hirschii]|uniref:hypothetical protein n=1 Tax=Prosthecodimorpha hirschii TaxID=665126 RepID=UPI0022201E03|nr:hypothetical protein [Prosthecomicrobium hirschii]MCW1842272.1 hypothetical protein [Prosthecomicrobium hirschii]
MTFAAETLLAELASEFGRAVAESRPVAIEAQLYGVISLALTGIAVEMGRLRADRDRVTAAYAAAVDECNRAVVTCNEALAVARQVVGVQEMAAAAMPLPAGVVRLPTRRTVPIRVPEGGQPA